MAKSLSSLVSTKTSYPPISVIYGVGGVGKTSLAAEYPDGVFIQTEGERTPEGIDLPTFGDMADFDDVLQSIESLYEGSHDRKTLIVDSLDGLEPLAWAATCKRLAVDSIEAPGFGKGYVEADKEWREYLARIAGLPRIGIAVVQLAHPEIVRFDSPTSDPYARYGIKLHKRAGALVRESADIVAFMNYRVTIKEKEVGPKKKIAHGESGGDRQIHLEERAGFVAKNRYNMPASISYKKGEGYAALAKFFPAPLGAANDNSPETSQAAA